jgi:hypothetical protein
MLKVTAQNQFRKDFLTNENNNVLKRTLANNFRLKNKIFFCGILFVVQLSSETYYKKVSIILKKDHKLTYLAYLLKRS